MDGYCDLKQLQKREVSGKVGLTTDREDESFGIKVLMHTFPIFDTNKLEPTNLCCSDRFLKQK